ncbi:Protein MAIN-LIKE 1 [Glycine soja]
MQEAIQEFKGFSLSHSLPPTLSFFFLHPTIFSSSSSPELLLFFFLTPNLTSPAFLLLTSPSSQKSLTQHRHPPRRVCSSLIVVFFLCTGSPYSATAPPLVFSSPGKLRVVFSLRALALSRTRGLGRALGHITGRGHWADAGAQAVEDEPEGFPGGPSDPSVLTEYTNHIASSVWTGEEHLELKLSSHGRKVHNLGRLVPAIEGLVVGTGLSPLIACSTDTGDRGLLSSFVERWHWETSSFHLPVGEMLMELLMVTSEATRAETGQCRGPYVRLQWVCDIYERRCHAGHWTAVACTFLLHLLGCTLFANKSATHVHVVFLEALHDLNQTERYAWGVAALTFIINFYDFHVTFVCWIYEHFPSVAESTADPDYDGDSPRACRWIATKKTVKSMRTSTYRERLDRLRISDFGYLLDPIWEAPTGPGLPYDFMLFRYAVMGAHCCVLPTREGHAAIWIHPDHSCSTCRFMGVV